MCVNPREVPVKGVMSAFKSSKTMLVPCGHCIECKKKYQNDWFVRLSHESEDWSTGVFFTLTYSDTNVPHTVDTTTGELFNSVSKEDVVLWFKRFRERYEKVYGNRFSGKYFITSEYGPRTLRPHYHGIIFGIRVQDFKTLALEDWEDRFGFTKSRALFTQDPKARFTALRYTVKYCAKGEFENPLVAQNYVLPNFKLISKGIGLSHVKKNKDYYLATRLVKEHYFSSQDEYIDLLVSRAKCNFLNHKGETISYGLPRYYRIKIYENAFLKIKISDYLRKMSDDLFNQKLEIIQSSFNLSSSEAVSALYMQEVCLLRQRARLSTEQYAKFLERSQL